MQNFVNLVQGEHFQIWGWMYGVVGLEKCALFNWKLCHILETMTDTAKVAVTHW